MGIPINYFRRPYWYITCTCGLVDSTETIQKPRDMILSISILVYLCGRYLVYT